MTNKTLTKQQAMRYSRQIMLSGFDLEKQEILMNTSVLMIGAGGLGCAAAQYIVAAGLGNITIIDDDRVDATNLQRQILYFESDIGEYKVDSARRTLLNINASVNVHTLNKRQNAKQLATLIEQHHLILDCSDNLTTRNLLNDLAYQFNTPLVSGAAIRMEGQVFCVVPQSQSSCYRCISQFFGEQNLSCMEAGVMSPVVGIVGATQAIEAIKVLTNYGTIPINKLQVFDAMTSHWESFNVPSLASCRICAKH